jgi:L-lactate dehydrogenase (cytochrome)
MAVSRPSGEFPVPPPGEARDSGEVKQQPGDKPLVNPLRRYGGIADLRRRAKRRVPGFAFDFVDRGNRLALARNRSALDAIEVVARYGHGHPVASSEVILLGRRYAAPIGVAPMGMGGLIWSGAEEYLAAAAQAAGIPYCLATPGAASIERIAGIAPDSFWFQTGSAPRNDFAITVDLARRARDAGAHVLLATIDTPVSPQRPREALTFPFRPSLRTILSIAASPAWLMQIMRRRAPRFENIVAYAGDNASNAKINRAGLTELRGGISWDAVHRLRDLWPRALVVKGVQHPADVDRVLSIGADGLVVSNHGARQTDFAPATVDLLPAIVERVAGRATILMDGGVRSGFDVVKALALGATGVLAGRPFLYGVGALGEPGASYVVDMMVTDIRDAMAQIGAFDCAAVRDAIVRHPGAYSFASVRDEQDRS